MKKFFLALIFTVCSCSSGKIDKNELVINDTIQAVLQHYIDDHPKYNTFMLRQSDSEIFCDTYFPRGVILGPGYQDIIEKENCRLFAQLGNARVYIESYVNNIIDNGYDEKWKNMNPEDTVIINNKPNVHSWHNYIYKAIFIYLDGGKVKVNTRPDTIFVSKQVESDITFTPIQVN